MLIYENTDNVNFISLSIAEETCDQNKILCRKYENGVQIDYTINEENRTVHMLYIESNDKNKGNGSKTLKEFLNDFIDYNIEIEAVFFLENWYEKFGFKHQYDIDEMFCCKMVLERELT